MIPNNYQDYYNIFHMNNISATEEVCDARLADSTARKILADIAGTTLVKLEKVIFNAPATIAFWSDGTKTVVKCYNEAFDPEKGLAMAVLKKTLGENRYRMFKRFVKTFDTYTICQK